MATIASIGGPTPSGLGGIPTPVLLGLVGGGLGLIVLLRRKSAGGGGSGTASDSTLLPNTAIMLGSIQESLLNMQGQEGADAANLSSQLTGTQESLSAQMDALTSQSQAGFTTLQNNLLGAGATQTQSILDAFKSQGDALAGLIHDNATAQAAYDQAFSDSVGKGFDAIVSSQNGELAALNNLQSTYATDTGNMRSQLSGLQSSINGLINTQPGPWGQYNGQIIAEGSNGKRTNPTGSWTYYVSNGKLFGIGDAASFLKLTGATPADYASGAADSHITMVNIGDAQLRGGMAGVLSGGNYVTESTPQGGANTIFWK